MSLFSIRLKQLRRRQGETQEILAEYLGITRATYSAYERDVIIPPYEKAKKIADRFGVNIDYLMGKSNDPIKGVTSQENDMDINKSLILISDMLCDDESILKFNEKVLSKKQKENILPIITNALNMIEIIVSYKD